MADNVVLDPGTGGATVKTDDDGTAHWQYIKAAYGADNTQTRVTSANGLPVQNDSANAFVVDLGATDNAVLDAIQAAVEASQTALEILDNVVSGNEAQVDVVSSALPTGAATSANQSTIIGHVDGIETVLGTIDTDTGNIAAGYAAEGAALGSGVLLQGDDGTDRKNISVDPTTGDVQVDVTNTVTVDGSGVTQPVSAASLPLPSGASTAANQSTLIGHVDGIEGLLTTIDADTSDIHTNSDTIAAGFATEGSALGSGVLMQADDGTDRTNVLVDTDGHLQVDVLSGGGSGTEYSEDAATPATILGTATVIERDDALTTVTPVEGDWIGLRGSAEGALWVQDFNSDAILADTANMDTNLGTIAGAVAGTEMQVDIVTSALPSGAATAANQSTIIGHVDGIEGLLTTMDTDTGAINTNTSTLAQAIRSEDDAHANGHSGHPILAVRNDDLATLAGTDGDYAMLQVTQNGALLTCPSANDDYKYAVIDDATLGDNTLVAAVASRKIRVLSLFMVSAGTVNARFEDGAAGTALTGQMNLAANTGFSLPFNPAGWFETSVNTLLNLELSAAISVDGSLTYIEVP